MTWGKIFQRTVFGVVLCCLPGWVPLAQYMAFHGPKWLKAGGVGGVNMPCVLLGITGFATHCVLLGYLDWMTAKPKPERKPEAGLTRMNHP